MRKIIVGLLFIFTANIKSGFSQSDLDSLLTKSVNKRPLTEREKARLKGFTLDSLLQYNKSKENERQKSHYAVNVKYGLAYTDQLFARLSAQRFIDNNRELQYSHTDITPRNMYLWAEHNGFNTEEKEILRRYMIPDEEKRKMTTNFQTSGFWPNFFESFGHFFEDIYDSFQSKAYKIRKELNQNIGRYEDVGEYSPFLSEIIELENTHKSRGYYTEYEVQRLMILRSNTDLLTHSQKNISDLGVITGKLFAWILIITIVFKIVKAIVKKTKKPESIK